MIKINRSQTPSILTTENQKIGGEKNRVITHVEANNLKVKDFSFSLYKRETVKSSLKGLLLEKCAYCESILSHSSYGHIEHWRPKAGVTENSNHKGYYWLASTWSNLFWACAVCNSQKYKGNRFPLVDSSKYAMKSTDNLTLEVPLLINPCTDNPDEHIKYDESGFIISITNKGSKSVEVYGLSRGDRCLSI